MIKIISLIFYLLIPILIFSFGVLFSKVIRNKKTSKIIQIVVISFFIALIIGFRSISVGNDTSSYYSSYQSMQGITLTQAFQKAHFEKGYLFITYLFSNARIPFFIFNFLVSGLLSVFLVLSCFHLSKYPALSIAIYICSGCFTLNMSSVRQTLAMALCFASVFVLTLLKDRKYYFKALSLIPWILAIFVHKSAALFAIAFACMFIRPKKMSSVIYFVIASLVIILFMPSISTQILFSNIKATETYSFFPPRASLSFSGTALMLYILITLFYVFYTDKQFSFDMSLKRLKPLNSLNNIIVINESKYFDDYIGTGMMFFMYIMYLGEQSISLLARGGLYGGLGMCIFIPNVLSKASKDEKTNPLFLVAVLLFFLLYFWFTTLKDNYLNLIPYGMF